MGLIGRIAGGVGRVISDAKAGFSAGAKGLSPDMQSWLTGLDVPDNEQGAKMVSPYMQSTWIYTAVSVMADSLSQIPFRVSRVGAAEARRVRALRGSPEPKHREFCRRSLGENIVESGDVVDLFECPHPTMDKTLFWSQIVSWDALRGEFFVVALDADDQPVDLAERRPRVQRMLTLDTGMFWHMVIGYKLEAWRYTGSPLISPLPSEMLTPTEVIHSRVVNPYLYWRGLSPLLVAMLPASADYAAAMFMKGLLMNNADTGIIATTDQALTQEQREQFTAALRERKRKAGTPDRPLFLSSGVKIEKPSISNVDMQFLETRRLLRQEIGAIYKVPESIMGFSDQKSSALSGGGNALNEEKLTFVEQNLASKCHRYEAAVMPILRTFGDDLVGWFDIEGLPIMQDARRARVDTASKVFAMGVPFNLANQVYDLGFPELAWGDNGFLPFNLQPADEMVAPEPAEEPPPDDSGAPSEDEENPMASMRGFLEALGKPSNPKPSNPEPRALSPEMKTNTKLLWQRHMRARASTVKLFRGKVGKVLTEFKGKTLDKLAEVHLEKGVDGRWQMADGKEVHARSLVDIIFSANEFGHALKLVLENPIRAALQQAGEEAREEVGAEDPWTMPPKAALEFIRSRDQAIMGTGGTVRDQLNTSLDEGYANGDTTAQLSARVKQVFNDLTDGEAERVARTETNIAFNAARHEALDHAGIEYKAWLSSHGPRVRPGHADAEDTYMDEPIPLSEPFIVEVDGDAEELMYPGDSSLGASAANIINCQCVQVAAEKASEDEDSKSYKIFGLGVVRFAHTKGAKTAKVEHGCN